MRELNGGKRIREGAQKMWLVLQKMWLIFKKTWEIFGKSSDFFDEISHVFMAYFLPLGLDVVLSNSKAVEPSPRSTRWALNFLPALL